MRKLCTYKPQFKSLYTDPCSLNRLFFLNFDTFPEMEGSYYVCIVKYMTVY